MVNPDNEVVADSDGMVVVSWADQDKVLAGVAAKSRVESNVREELLRGGSLGAVWEKHHVL